ncbi:MAG: hypothetical protein RRB13_09045 [bacterium]|nr:hypothetical protein [bacterium]
MDWFKNALIFCGLLGLSIPAWAEESRLELRLIAVDSGPGVFFSRDEAVSNPGDDTFTYGSGGMFGVRIAGDRLSITYLKGSHRLTSSTSDNEANLDEFSYSGECSSELGTLDHTWYSEKPQARSQWTFSLSAGVLSLTCTNKRLSTDESFDYSARTPVLGFDLTYIFSGSFFVGFIYEGGLGGSTVDYQQSSYQRQYTATTAYTGGFMAGLVF